MYSIDLEYIAVFSSRRDSNVEVLCYMTAILNDARDNEDIRTLIEQFDFASIVSLLIEQLENVPANKLAQIFNAKAFEMISAILVISE